MKKFTLLITLLGLLITSSASASATKLEVKKFNYDAPGNDNYNLNGEFVVLKNISGKKLRIQKWEVIDNDGHKTLLPKMVLKKGQRLKIYTGNGRTKKKGKLKKVYWGHNWGLWNNDGDVLRVKNHKGKTVLQYEY